jgi:hypothetical protein
VPGGNTALRKKLPKASDTESKNLAAGATKTNIIQSFQGYQKSARRKIKAVLRMANCSVRLLRA